MKYHLIQIIFLLFKLFKETNLKNGDLKCVSCGIFPQKYYLLQRYNWTKKFCPDPFDERLLDRVSICKGVCQKSSISINDTFKYVRGCVPKCSQNTGIVKHYCCKENYCNFSFKAKPDRLFLYSLISILLTLPYLSVLM